MFWFHGLAYGALGPGRRVVTLADVTRLRAYGIYGPGTRDRGCKVDFIGFVFCIVEQFDKATYLGLMVALYLHCVQVARVVRSSCCILGCRQIIEEAGCSRTHVPSLASSK